MRMKTNDAMLHIIFTPVNTLLTINIFTNLTFDLFYK